MIDNIISDPRPVTLVGGGDATPDELHKALKLAPVCVAVDSGADLAIAAKAHIAAVIGDFDSISEEALALVPSSLCHNIAEQDSTDFEKALTRVRAPVVIGVGFMGARVDHQLAAFHTLAAHADRPCVLLGPHEIICLAPPSLDLVMEKGQVVSLFPMGEVTGRSTGLAWPIEGLQFAPSDKIGTSNHALGPVTLAMDAPEMLLILPRDLMPALVTALSQPDAARWPARAG